MDNTREEWIVKVTEQEESAMNRGGTTYTKKLQLVYGGCKPVRVAIMVDGKGNRYLVLMILVQDDSSILIEFSIYLAHFR